MKIRYLLFCLIAMSIVGCSRSSAAPAITAAASPMPTLGTLSPFHLTDQDGRPVRREDVIGHPSIAAFIFTSCPSTCPAVVASLKRVRSKIADPNVKCYLFSVDPENDTPKVLAKYAHDNGLAKPTWELLTGDKKQILAVMQGMHLAAPGAKELSVSHSSRLFLIDANGNMRALYRFDSREDCGKLIGDVATLEPPK